MRKFKTLATSNKHSAETSGHSFRLFGKLQIFRVGYSVGDDGRLQGDYGLVSPQRLRYFGMKMI